MTSSSVARVSPLRGTLQRSSLSRRLRLPLALLLLCALAPAALAQKLAPRIPPPDARYKADILVIVAHPDDETLITGYLAHAIYDEHKRVAVAFCTWGRSGGNLVGEEQGLALAAEREIEARRALAYMGIHNVWYLGGRDHPGNDVLDSLERWGEGAVLERAVRIIRLTRPEVVMTMAPDNDWGENHPDHHASGVIATEAFDLAGNPTAFAEQVAPPRNRLGYANLTEGLQPWQAEKLYYFSNANSHHYMDKYGPTFRVTGICRAKGLTYAQIAAHEAAFHATQQGTGDVAAEALRTGNYTFWNVPDQFVLAKALVPSAPTARIFAGVVPGPLPYSPPPGYRTATDPTLDRAIQLGNPWRFYRQFWAAHGLPQMPHLYEPEKTTGAGAILTVPLVLRNMSTRAARMRILPVLPRGWRAVTAPALYPVAAGQFYPVRFLVAVPKSAAAGWHHLRWRAVGGGASGAKVRTARLHVYVNR